MSSRTHRTGHNRGNKSLILAALDTFVHAFQDNEASQGVSLAAGAVTVVVSKSVTPRTTGKFRVFGWMNVTNTSTGVTHKVQLSIGHDNAGTPVVDYAGNASGISAAFSEVTHMGIGTEYGVAPGPVFSFPVNVPVIIELQAFADAGAGTDLSVKVFDAQLIIQEIP